LPNSPIPKSNTFRGSKISDAIAAQLPKLPHKCRSKPNFLFSILQT
jgi:hypothetical protein